MYYPARTCQFSFLIRTLLKRASQSSFERNILQYGGLQHPPHPLGYPLHHPPPPPPAPPRHRPISPPLPPSPPSLPIIATCTLLSLPLHHSLLRSPPIRPVFLLRLGSRRAVVVSSVAAIQECLVKNDLTFSDRPFLPSVKDLTFDHTPSAPPRFGPSGKAIADAPNAVLFSPAIIQSLSAGIIHQEVKVMLRSLLRKGKGGGGVCTLRPKLSELTMNVIMRAVAGKRCFGEDEDDATEIGRKFRWAVEEYFRLINAVSVADLLPFLKWVGAGLWDRAERRRVRRELGDLVAELLDEVRKQRCNKKKDKKSINTANTTVVEALVEMQEREGEDHYNGNYLEGMIQSLLIAGIPTITEQLEWTMALLLNHPEAKNKATSEINSLVGHDRLLDYSDIPNLPYLSSIVKESFRLCPVDPLLVPRESRNECTIGGFHVPSGTMLIPNVYAVYQDPEHWTDPTSFKPERFLDAEEKMKDLETVYFPFGIGRRNCPGSGLAMRVILMALGGLLQCFEWERVGEELVDMTEGRAFDVPMLKPLVAKYKARHAMLPLLS
ncbi:isoflavone 3'-hydroxylase-like [Asparagus officinalis]|uniref:isoflavone 3'-hydroxylase-like n=1 Tax=Asparagus officinalis TaxID=4686 RepID=UPI00098E4BB7|nr:isoflavone 3'-hydroxylase-like [Asparagus officinalis]